MKNLLKTHKRIIGVFVIAFVAFLCVPTVWALTDDDYCRDANYSQDAQINLQSTVIGRYGIEIEDLDNNVFKISMNPDSNRAERCETEFRITTVNGEPYNQGYDRISCTSPLTFWVEDLTKADTTTGLPGVVAELEAYDVISQERSSTACYYRKVIIKVEISASAVVKTNNTSCPNVDVTDASVTSSLDCSAPQTSAFNIKFCEVKNKAIAAGNDKSSSIVNGSYSGSQLDFKCNYELSGANALPEDYMELEGDDYFLNKQYLYGSYTFTESKGHYTYEYSPGVITEGEEIECKVKCEEAVEVEYGPPVASAGGMCFEYKVRVTSRVSCNMVEAPESPEDNCNYCTPTPRCVGHGGVWLQGGPNEEFDQCVQNCDGGKYTQKCSNKCYKKVYGSTIVAGAQINNRFLNMVATRLVSDEELQECIELGNPYGCYYESGWSTVWYDSGEPRSYGTLNCTGEGRWYTENRGGKYHNGNYILAESDGFWRMNYGGGSYCHDDCEWIDCRNDNYKYYNAGYAERDYKENMELRNDAVKSCQAKATCTTTTSEYTISADYTQKGSVTVTTLNFPSDGSKDTVTHAESGVVSSTETNPYTTLMPNYPGDGEGLWGCYKSGAPEPNLYRTTWGFPASWKNKKTGEVSYKDKCNGATEENCAWAEFSYQFCIPSDAKNVNAYWWNQYYHRELDVKDSLDQTTVTSYTTFRNECREYLTSRTDTVTTVNYTWKQPEDKIEWNIRAVAEDFGYFAWDIMMECFYAVNDDPLCISDCCDPDAPCVDETTVPESTPDECTKPEPDNYRIHTTDAEDIFNVRDENSTEKRVGYNWTEYATNTKNPAYPSNPVAYKEKVEQEAQAARASGTDYYSEDRLDYEFNLTPQVLRQMRSDVAGAGITNYTSFRDSDFKTDPNGVSRYYSNKIRSIPGSHKIPEGNAIYCNNMVRYSSTECDPVHN